LFFEINAESGDKLRAGVDRGVDMGVEVVDMKATGLDN
jgi:hypothetical protein